MIGRILCLIGRHRWKENHMMPGERRCTRKHCRAYAWRGWW